MSQSGDSETLVEVAGIEPAGAKISVKKALRLERKFRAKFVEDDDFDGLWDSFGEE